MYLNAFHIAFPLTTQGIDRTFGKDYFPFQLVIVNLASTPRNYF